MTTYAFNRHLKGIIVSSQNTKYRTPRYTSMVTYELKIPYNETQVPIHSKHGFATADFLKSNPFTPAREVRR